MPVFFRFTPQNKRFLWLLAIVSLVSVVLYLSSSAIYYHIGFPLDDSWIHLTYARNLALFGEWAYQPGKLSAGSTSPLWTSLLSIGFVLKLSPFVWTYFLGALCLLGLGLFSEIIVRQISKTYQSRIPWVGLFMIIEWHLVWSAVSGMETLLHALLVTIVLGMLMVNSHRFMTLGLLTGLSVWVRPDGLTLVGPVILYALVSSKSRGRRVRDVTVFLLGFASLFVPYILFNLVLSGTPMPNTFYAKQAEYSAWQAKPLIQRVLQLMIQFLVGPSLALLIGALAWLVIALRQRNWGTLAGMVWFGGYLFLYSQRLPVYQHGRYVIPAMPIYFIWGLLALLNFTKTITKSRMGWVMRIGWQQLLFMLSIVFWIFGAWTYAQDVAVIESEMVASAKWVAENIPGEAIIAAHDIGALGYFDDHSLIDMAGLVSPEVIPFIRDEIKMAQYLDANQVAYIVAFPDFYPYLTSNAEPVYLTNGAIAPRLGGENMVVYRWR